MNKEQKTVNIHFRVSESECKQIDEASERVKLTRSAYARMIVVSDAEKRNRIAERLNDNKKSI